MMIVVRRWYIYLFSAVSLQVVTWAIIYLIQNLLTPGFSAPVESIAFQIAVIIIGLPMFLVHWLWAQRLAGRDPNERQSTVRQLYLYVTLAAFLIPFVASAFDLLKTVLGLLLGRVEPDAFSLYSPTEIIIQALITLIILALLWFYHWRVIAEDRQIVPETEQAATVRRFYIFGFSAGGLAL